MSRGYVLSKVEEPALSLSKGERRSEIGLLKAVGATSSQVYGVLLFESVLLAGVGSGIGLCIGFVLIGLLKVIVPGLPLGIKLNFILAALIISTMAGLAAGVLPARRAARIDSVHALHAG